MSPNGSPRRATTGDAPGIAAVHDRSWRASHRGHVPEDQLDAVSVAARTNAWLARLTRAVADVFVVEDEGGEIVGFCSLIASGDDDAGPETGEIAVMHVAPERWREGLGRTLLSHAIEAARRRGFENLTLWVVEGNQRARAFYEAFELTPDGTSKDLNRGAYTLRVVRYRRTLGAS